MVVSRRMFRRLVVSMCLLVAITAWCASAAAETKLDRLARALRTSDDFRVRTQAALALGATKSKRAVSPLCKALDDPSATVRAASAAALGKLRLGGRTCLEKRLPDETSGSVKSTIKKALARFKKASDAEPTITSETRYYVAIGKIVDKTGRKSKKLVELIKSAMSKAAQGLDGYAVAPDGETEAKAKKRLAKYKEIKGFYLSPTVAKPKYVDGNLTIKIDVAIFSYPNRALKGTLPVKLTQQDVAEKDEDAEDELFKMAAERVVEKFADSAERIQ